MAMLANVHLAHAGGGGGDHDDDDDDLYSGFGTEEVAPALQTEDLEFDEGFQVRGCCSGIISPQNDRVLLENIVRYS